MDITPGLAFRPRCGILPCAELFFALWPGHIPATVLLFQFVAIWNNYLLPLVMLNNEKLFPITVGLAVNRFLAIPGSFVSAIPLLIGCVFLQRYWRGGLGTGSVKG